MSICVIDGPEDPDRKRRIEELERQVKELGGGQGFRFKSDDIPPELEEQFLRNIIEYETATWTTHFKQLQKAGVELPEPKTLDDAAISNKLWEIIRALAEMRVFLVATNHLSDRELYTELWTDALLEETPELTLDEGAAFFIDFVSSGSDEHTHQWLKHYADQQTRDDWKSRYPEYEMPDHQDPPFDRDRHLPAAGF
jgi:hypothetical protein